MPLEPAGLSTKSRLREKNSPSSRGLSKFDHLRRFATRENEGIPQPPYTSTPNAQYYYAFYGRGIMQLTWPGNYALYGKFRQLTDVPATHSYGDTLHRISATSTHHWSDKNDTPRVWFPRYDPEVIADDAFAACDSGGFYWVSKVLIRATNTININRATDQPFDLAAVTYCSYLVNGGSYGFKERHQWAKYVYRHRSDSTATNMTEAFQTRERNGTVHQLTVDYTPQRP